MSKNKIVQMVEKRKQHFDFLQTIKRFFPIIVWLPQYNLTKLKGDVIAGLTVGIMTVPQGIAFANVAGLPIQYGLYTSLTPGLIYSIFGTSKDANVGATATMSLFTNKLNTTRSPIGASLLGFWCGIVLLAVGVFRLGFVTKFVPYHVINAFVSAAAITIAISQFPNLLGIKGAPTNTFMILDYLRQKIKTTNKHDVTLGILCIVYLGFFMWLSKRKLNNSSGRFKTARTILNKIVWLVCTARMVLVCIIATIAVYIFYKHGITTKFSVAGKLPQGMPKWQNPFATATLSKNATRTAAEFTNEFGISLIVLPMIQFIEQYSITKGFGRKFNYKVSARQELIALGMCNIAGSFYGGWPVCGSFSRSAVNSMSGAQTPLAGAISFFVVVIALEFFTKAFFYIPKSSLSAMMIMAVITMVETRVPKHIWNLYKWDLLPFLTTFWLCFYNLEYGILAGTGVSLLYVIAREAFPRYYFNADKESNSLTVVLKANLTYPGSETLNRKIHSLIRQNPGLQVLNLDMSNTLYVDFSVLKSFETLQNELSELSIKLCFVGIKKESVKKQFESAKLFVNDEICPDIINEELPSKAHDEVIHRRPTLTQLIGSSDSVLSFQETVFDEEENLEIGDKEPEGCDISASIDIVDNIHFKEQ